MFRLHFKGVGLPILPQVKQSEDRGWAMQVGVMHDDRILQD